MLVDMTNFGLVLCNHANFYRFEETSSYWSVKVYTDTMGSYSNTREVNRGSFPLLFLLLSVIRKVHFFADEINLL